MLVAEDDREARDLREIGGHELAVRMGGDELEPVRAKGRGAKICWCSGDIVDCRNAF